MWWLTITSNFNYRESNSLLWPPQSSCLYVVHIINPHRQMHIYIKPTNKWTNKQICLFTKFSCTALAILERTGLCLPSTGTTGLYHHALSFFKSDSPRRRWRWQPKQWQKHLSRFCTRFPGPHIVNISVHMSMGRWLLTQQQGKAAERHGCSSNDLGLSPSLPTSTASHTLDNGQTSRNFLFYK